MPHTWSALLSSPICSMPHTWSALLLRITSPMHAFTVPHLPLPKCPSLPIYHHQHMSMTSIYMHHAGAYVHTPSLPAACISALQLLALLCLFLFVQMLMHANFFMCVYPASTSKSTAPTLTIILFLSVAAVTPHSLSNDSFKSLL